MTKEMTHWDYLKAEVADNEKLQQALQIVAGIVLLRGRRPERAEGADA